MCLGEQSVMMPLKETDWDLMETLEIPSDVSYRGEGNSSVVVALPKTNKILRLYKRKKPQTILDWFVNFLKTIFNWDCKAEMNRESSNLCFYSEVMKTLLGTPFVCDAKQVYISRKQVHFLDKKLIDMRPGQCYLLLYWTIQMIS